MGNLSADINLQFKNVAISIQNTANSARRAGNRRMEAGAIQVMEDAKNLAPIDEGNLEDAIMIDKSSTFGNRNVYEVYVDTSMPGSNGADRLSDYANRMHEDTSYKLGPISARKDLGMGGNGMGYNYGGVVGSGFLTRAFDYNKDAIEDQIEDAIMRELR